MTTNAVTSTTTTADPTRCAGAATCKRPATWTIDTSYGTVYPAQQTREWTVNYCKAHAEAEVARLLELMPWNERRALYNRNKRRQDGLHRVGDLISVLKNMEIWTNAYREERDEDAAFVAEANDRLALLGLDTIAAELQALYDYLAAKYIVQAPK